MTNEKTCFNCCHSKETKGLDAGVPVQSAKCTNNNVDEEWFEFFDEILLPEYCENHEFKQEANT